MNSVVSYTYTYPYRLLPFWSMRLQPVVPVDVFYGRRDRLRITTLLDSGADFPMFSLAVAEDLGIDLATLSQVKIRGVGGYPKAYRQKLGLKFGPLPQPIGCYVYFVEGLPIHLLGRAGVFNHVQIGFDEANKRVHMALNA